MKISKFKSMGFPKAQPTMTTNGALKRAVCSDGAKQ